MNISIRRRISGTFCSLRCCWRQSDACLEQAGRALPAKVPLRNSIVFTLQCTDTDKQTKENPNQRIPRGLSIMSPVTITPEPASLYKPAFPSVTPFIQHQTSLPPSSYFQLVSENVCRWRYYRHRFQRLPPLRKHAQAKRYG